jgi:excisionase family DNA binding protein
MVQREEEMNGLITTQEAAVLFSVHINTIRNWIHSGVLKAYKVNNKGRWRIRKEDLEALLKEEK